MLLQYQACHVQHMQKALTEMNLKLDNVLSDIVGMTGLAILRAIVAGERDAEKLAALRDPRVKASAQGIARSLQGNWREEHLFAFAQALALYEAYQQRPASCDAKLEEMLKRLARQAGTLPVSQRRPRSKNAPRFDLRQALYAFCGVDLTSINGIDVTTELKVLSEVGCDLSRFRNAKHFCSWIELMGWTPPCQDGKKVSD